MTLKHDRSAARFFNLQNKRRNCLDDLWGVTIANYKPYFVTVNNVFLLKNGLGTVTVTSVTDVSL